MNLGRSSAVWSKTCPAGNHPEMMPSQVSALRYAFTRVCLWWFRRA